MTDLNDGMLNRLSDVLLRTTIESLPNRASVAKDMCYIGASIKRQGCSDEALENFCKAIAHATGAHEDCVKGLLMTENSTNE